MPTDAYEARVSVTLTLPMPPAGVSPVAAAATFENRSVTYRLDRSLPLDDVLVLQRRGKLIGQIKLDKLIENLGRLTLLVDLAYNAVPKREGALVAALNQMQTDYASLCQQCAVAMGEVRSSAEEIGLALNGAMEDLFNGDEDLAVGGIGDCAAIAGRLADLMKVLSDAFDNLASRADNALTQAHLTRGDEIKAKEALEKAKTDWEATKARSEKLASELKTLIDDFQSKYDKLEKTLETTENRAFAISLTGAIMKPLGEGLGGAATAIALIYSGPPTRRGGGDAQDPPKPAATGKDNASQEVPEDKRKELDKSEDLYEDSALALEVAKDDLEILAAEAEVLEEEISAAGDGVDTTELKDRKRLIEQIEQAIEQVKPEREKTAEERKRDFDGAKSAIEALGYTLSSAGTQFSQMGHDYLELAESQRAQLERIFELMVAKKDLEREQLGIVAEAGVRLEGIKSDIESSAVTIKALVIVIAALRQVSDILHDAAEFWRAMKKGCEALSTPDFASDLDRRRDKSGLKTAEQRANAFDREALKTRLLHYKADWAALQNVAEEYQSHTTDLYQDARERRSVTLVGDAAQARVDALATKLIGDVKAAQEAIDRDVKAMKDAKELQNHSAAA